MRHLSAMLALCAALIGAPTAALAQAGVTYGKVQTPWFQQGKIAAGISVTSASAATLLPTTGLQAWICNTGANDAYLGFGTANTVAATVAGSSWLKAGSCGNYDLFPFFNATRNSYVAAITGSSTTTLTVETGVGSGPIQPGTATLGPSGSPTTIIGSVTTDGVLDAVVSSASVSSAAVGATFNTAGYGSMSFEVVANPGFSVIAIEGSNDGGTTWASIAVRNTASTATAGSQGIGFNGGTGLTFVPTVVMAQMRWRVSTFVSGTTTIATGLKRSQSPNVIEANVYQQAGSPGTMSGSITGPTSTITLPATTTAFTAGFLIANSATAGSVVNPSFAIANSAGAVAIPRVRLSVNDTTSTAWAGQTVQVDLWSTTPTWTNGNLAAWLPATGSAGHVGSYTCTFPTPVWGDGIATECSVTVGNYAGVKLASGTSIFWSLKATTGSGVTGASKVFTLTPELVN